MALSPEKVAGIIVTVSIHIAVAIPLLALQLGFEVQKEQSFILDFTKEEEQEKEQQEQQEKQQKQELNRSAAQKLDQMIATSAPSVRNIAVNRSSQLKDDRNTDADQLYRDAARLAEELRNGQKETPPEKDDIASLANPNTNNDNKSNTQPQAYSGASVLYWQLDGRNATHLPVPAYRCYGAGEVTVIITVDNAGRVIDARIDESATSSGDSCLRNHAIRAARSSMFNASQSAPAKQKGTITYQFVAQ